ncbi:MAG: XdhC family protein, partial [Planctomycetota bacterium]
DASSSPASGEARADVLRVPLSEKAGQCCGGEVTLYVESFPWRRAELVVFGAGHVAQAVAGLGDYMGVDVRLVDGRSAGELEPPLPADPPYEVLFVDAPEAEIDGLSDDALVLVMTHDHALDQEIIARCLKRSGLAYVGLIGSDRKWARFRQRLGRRGFTDDDLARITCPIGVVKGSKAPRSIALSVATQVAEVVERLSSAEGAPR